jgi:hypothetical protein
LVEPFSGAAAHPPKHHMAGYGIMAFLKATKTLKWDLSQRSPMFLPKL